MLFHYSRMLPQHFSQRMASHYSGGKPLYSQRMAQRPSVLLIQWPSIPQRMWIPLLDWLAVPLTDWSPREPPIACASPDLPGDLIGSLIVLSCTHVHSPFVVFTVPAWLVRVAHHFPRPHDATGAVFRKHFSRNNFSLNKENYRTKKSYSHFCSAKN